MASTNSSSGRPHPVVPNYSPAVRATPTASGRRQHTRHLMGESGEGSNSTALIAVNAGRDDGGGVPSEEDTSMPDVSLAGDSGPTLTVLLHRLLSSCDGSGYSREDAHPVPRGCKWSDSGNSFLILDKAVFMQTASERGVCRSSIWDSFARQMKNYEFALVKPRDPVPEYWRENFTRGDEDSAAKITPKHRGSRGTVTDVNRVQGPSLQDLQDMIATMGRELRRVKSKVKELERCREADRRELQVTKETCEEQARRIANFESSSSHSLDTRALEQNKADFASTDLPTQSQRHCSRSTPLQASPADPADHPPYPIHLGVSFAEAITSTSQGRYLATTIHRTPSFTTANRMDSPTCNAVLQELAKPLQPPYSYDGILMPTSDPLQCLPSHGPPVASALPSTTIQSGHIEAVASRNYVHPEQPPGYYPAPVVHTPSHHDAHHPSPSGSRSFQPADERQQSNSGSVTFPHLNYFVGTVAPPAPGRRWW